jgi:Uncharacterized protein conserved in bacteria
MSFPSALALGVAGEEEVVELDLTELVEADEVIRKLNDASYVGLTFFSAKPVTAGRKKAVQVASVFEMAIPDGLLEQVAREAVAFLAKSSVSVVKHNGKTVDVRTAVRQLGLCGNLLKMVLAVTGGSDAGFREVLEVLGLREYLFRTIFPVRTKVLLADEGESPEFCDFATNV